ncbi:exodeoxyribonuclease VII small subunit [Lentilactobacillus kribbianus]|uniref:exodeoxyribonuclease VII small subunit n=1 Tax=Lentilactobacillus kribbianus TaxID=2729622 RepID=UPI001558291E|nr:exodeoxyribonuclease VII small subunit [Lentilactobacillus kribbianus]
MASNQTFEEKMQELEQIVNQLEQGNTPLEESMNQFKKGIELTTELQKTLTQAETTMAKIVDKDGNESAFEVNEETDTNE